jgi:MerR family transcriptional regulator, heat shock protein HspR
MAREPAGLAISAVSRRTGIPITTLRFYERELPSLFQIRKTAGGHRRYGEIEVSRFVTVRRLTEQEGLRLSEVRRALASRDEPDVLREELDRVREAQTAETDVLQALLRRIGELEGRVAALEASGPPRRRRWLRGP